MGHVVRHTLEVEKGWPSRWVAVASGRREALQGAIEDAIRDAKVTGESYTACRIIDVVGRVVDYWDGKAA